MAQVIVPSFDSKFGEQEASICNLGLARLTVDPIFDTVLDDSKQASICKMLYAKCRDSLLKLQDELCLQANVATIIFKLFFA